MINNFNISVILTVTIAVSFVVIVVSIAILVGEIVVTFVTNSLSTITIATEPIVAAFAALQNSSPLKVDEGDKHQREANADSDDH